MRGRPRGVRVCSYSATGDLSRAVPPLCLLADRGEGGEGGDGDGHRLYAYAECWKGSGHTKTIHFLGQGRAPRHAMLCGFVSAQHVIISNPSPSSSRADPQQEVALVWKDAIATSAGHAFRETVAGDGDF